MPVLHNTPQGQRYCKNSGIYMILIAYGYFLFMRTCSLVGEISHTSMRHVKSIKGLMGSGAGLRQRIEPLRFVAELYLAGIVTCDRDHIEAVKIIICPFFGYLLTIST